MEGSVEHYNKVRLKSAIGYITPKDMLAGRRQEIDVQAGSEAGRGANTAADSSAAGRMKNEWPSLRAAEASDEVDYFDGRIRKSPWPMLWGHSVISPLHPKWALVNTTVC